MKELQAKRKEESEAKTPKSVFSSSDFIRKDLNVPASPKITKIDQSHNKSLSHSVKNFSSPGPSKKAEKIRPPASKEKNQVAQSKPAISQPTLKRKATSPPLSKPKKIKPVPQMEFGKIMDGVVFAISGYVNPERARIRDAAVKMGAKYERDINTNVTHLICAVPNTPKYNQFIGRGKIMKKEWIFLQSETKKVRENKQNSLCWKIDGP